MRVKSLESRVKSRKRLLTLRSYSGSRLLALSSRPCRGMTLVELLVVIVIITTLVAAAIPLLSPANDDRREREASRQVNTFITGAQARAISLRRPVGVALKRLGSDTNTNSQKHTDPTKNFHDDNGVCLEMFYVEELPPYAGFDTNSRASVAITTNGVLIRFETRGTQFLQNQDGLPAGWDPDFFPEATIHPGDVIEISGTQYRMLAPAGATGEMVVDGTTGCFKFNYNYSQRIAMLFAQPVNDSGQQINPRYDSAGFEIGAVASPNAPYWTLPAPYKVLRQPTAMSDEPLQLPEGTAIDLRASGVGSSDYFYVPGINDNDQGVVIMFTPEGRVARVAYYHKYPPISQNDQPYDQPVAENIYLLVGRRDRVAPPAVASDPTLQSSTVNAATTDELRAKLRGPINWLNGDSRWIVIGAQTGRVATIENAAVDLASVLQAPSKPFNTASPSTEEMRCAQILAAREFTHEMAQVGGR